MLWPPGGLSCQVAWEKREQALASSCSFAGILRVVLQLLSIPDDPPTGYSPVLSSLTVASQLLLGL